MIVACICGAEFTTYPARIADGRGKYCSKKCGYKNRTRPVGLTYNIVTENRSWFKFKGGHIDHKGYLRFTVKGRLKLVHRLAIEKHLGRELLAHEVVHHIDGNKLNNTIENLQVVTKTEHDNFHNGKSRKGRI